MLVTNPTQLNMLLARLSMAKHFAFDTETTGLTPYSGDRIIGLSFGIPLPDGGVDTYYVPFRHERGHRLNFDRKSLLRFTPLFADQNKTVVGWNAKFDCHFLHADGIEVEATVLDAMLAWHLKDENFRSFGLKDLARIQFGSHMIQDDKDLSTLLKSEKIDKGAMAQLSPIEAAPYAESDASLTWRLFRVAVQTLQDQGLAPLFREICQYARVMERVERKGIKIDPVKCEELIEVAQERDVELLAELRSLAGPDFNPKSSPQCCKWLGLPSSAKEYLLEMEDVPGVSQLLEYRGHSKALGSFYLPFRSRRDRFNRLHANFKLHGTPARLSCAEPNLQQLPRTSNQWARVKDMVVAASGCVLLETDLSQAEFRLMAHYTQDPALLSAYQSPDADMHQFIADALGIDRHRGKTLNFSIIYGGGVPTVSKQLGISEKEAKTLLTAYHKRLPGVKKLFYRLRDMAEGQGYVKLWTGRRRHYPYINGERAYTQTAMNNLIQGGVAEIVRHAMCRLDSELPEGAWMVAQVHDSILVECKKSMLGEVSCLVKRALETSQFRVPFLADQKWGSSWGTMQKL